MWEVFQARSRRRTDATAAAASASGTGTTEPKLPVVEHEPAALRALARRDLADEHHVVAGAMPAVVAAFEPRGAPVDQRRIRPAHPVADAGEAVRMRPRKAAREFGLVGGQHVDAVALRGLERGRLTERRDRLHSTSGGSSDTELNELAVSPT